MKDPFRFNPVLVLCMFLLPLLWACSKNADPLDPPSSNDGKVSLAIHIAPVNTRANEETDYFDDEKIKSLRIILIGTDNETGLDTIEFNKYISVENGGVRADDFKYDYVWRTKPGNKKFYLIANEESVGTVGSSSETGDPASPSESLSDLLEAFSDGTPAGNLDDALKDLSFIPDFDNTGGDVFLPYSAVYDDITLGERDFQEVTMFLVPVATKFMFYFTNNRPYTLSIYDISLAFTNSKSYLLGHVNEPDVCKELEGQELYWVDWLAEISELSQGYTGFYPNMSFNELYGWISNYDIPEDDAGTSVLVGANNAFTISASETTDPTTSVPGTKTAGPYYIPESKNFQLLEYVASRDQDQDQDSAPIPPQTYYLSLSCVDVDAPKPDPKEFNDLPIDNLKALFRNTCVIIYISFSQGEGDVDIYAEIADWNKKSIQGWVTDAPAPPGITFP